jgi:rfaE bifunctional protein nucleotidyltransferase chain/domain
MSNSNLQNKIIDRESAKRISRELRDTGRILVFTNGCFDILHPGHSDLLTKARNLGDALMIGLNTDSSVKRLKGETRPVNNQIFRANALAALDPVDFVVLFDEDTPANLIDEILPMILVKGGDYCRETVVGHEVVEAHGGKIVIIPLVPGYSTSDILRKSKCDG